VLEGRGGSCRGAWGCEADVLHEARDVAVAGVLRVGGGLCVVGDGCGIGQTFPKLGITSRAALRDALGALEE
ncbi:hypothetical protein ACWCOY_36705, partial [Streptomyces tubercidicus]